MADARAALDRGRPGTALRIFITRMVGMPTPVGWLMPLMVRVNATMRSFVPRQIDDTEAINLLGNRLDAYASITAPVLLLTGARTPAHLRERTDRLAAVLPGDPPCSRADQRADASPRGPAVGRREWRARRCCPERLLQEQRHARERCAVEKLPS